MSEPKLELIARDPSGDIRPGSDWPNYIAEQGLSIGNCLPFTISGIGLCIGSIILEADGEIKDIHRVVEEFTKTAEPPLKGDNVERFLDGLYLAKYQKWHREYIGTQLGLEAVAKS